MKLKLIDTSAILHSGNALFPNFGVGKADYILNKPYSFPTGAMYGVLSLFKKKGFLNLNSKDDRVIFCFDRPSFRKQINSSYKSNRPKNPGLLLQSIELEKGLKSMGFDTVAYEGYEADDVIYGLVKENYNKFNEIEIYGTDRDLAALVDYKVSLISTSKNVPSINIGNFSKKVIPGVDLPLNSIYLFKLVFGDASDCIKPLLSLNERTYNAFLATINKIKAHGINDLNSHEALDLFINNTANEVTKRKLIETKELILPKVPQGVILTPIEQNLSEKEIINFLSTFKMKSIAKHLNVLFDDTIGNDYIEYLNKKLHEMTLNVSNNMDNVGVQTEEDINSLF